MVKPIRKSSNKNLSYFSHEFIIQNHADIVSCVVMLFFIALMIQSTSSLAANFVLLQHNVTELTHDNQATLYKPGFRDLCTITFYTLIFVIFHAIVQEYFIDKVSKKLHLSKSKLAIFTTSCQYSIFYFISVISGCYIIYIEKYFPYIYLLWVDYPAPLSFSLKLYILFQISYCLHELPEIYFQKVKKDEQLFKIRKCLTETICITIPYYLNFNRLLLYLIVLHHISEFINNLVHAIQVIDKDEEYQKYLKLSSNIALIFSRIATATLAILTLKFGLSFDERSSIDWENGNFNVYFIRMCLLFAIGILQGYIILNFSSQIMGRVQEHSANGKIIKNGKIDEINDFDKKNRKKKESDLPEVDQYTKGIRSKKKIK